MSHVIATSQGKYTVPFYEIVDNLGGLREVSEVLLAVGLLPTNDNRTSLANTVNKARELYAELSNAYGESKIGSDYTCGIVVDALQAVDELGIDIDTQKDG